ncbi:hypothetical protein RN001_014309 [Aquatica leii]|uniref:Major facilitator superfamily (MFS) profile domain-containing protein n=1 Tax=Aquatica leii TaxID=1421715 RepID=A0AAN7SEH3_9COLE|nr:hypothetical protein RN001_014309 [Aquatica leii]
MTLFFRLKKIRYMQYVCVFTVSLLAGSITMISTWMSPVLPLLNSHETPLNAPLTDTEEMWLVSVQKLGSVIGCILAALLSDAIGRKFILLLSAIPLIISMTTAAFTKSATVLIIFRAIEGIGSGIIFVVLPVYVSEVSDKDIRGGLGIVHLIISSLCGVYVYSAGPFISYIALSISCAIIPLVFVILFIFMPETPYYLVKKGNLNSATKSLKQLSGEGLCDSAIQSKIQEIQDFVDREVRNKGSWKELVFDAANRKALVITLVLRTVLVFSGLFVVLSYLQTLFEQSGSNISPEVSSIIFSVINMPLALTAVFLVDKVGRRLLFLVSTFGCALSLIAVGIYFFLQVNGDVADILWLPTTGLSLYIALSSLGINSIPGVLQGEMFSINVKSIASSFVIIYGSSISFLLLRFFQPLADKFGTHVMFWFFGGVCVVGFVFGMFVLPETKGKTFSEIQELLDKSKKNKDYKLETSKSKF